MKYKYYTIIRKDNESNSMFLTRVANEIQLMTIKILDFEVNLERGYASIMFIEKD